MEQVYDAQQALGMGDRGWSWRQAIGIAALVAAALLTILFTTPAMPEPPATDSACQLDLLVGKWTGSGCDSGPDSAPAR